jgi:hypothetical protein
MQETNPTHYTAKGKECIVEMYEKFGHDAVMYFCQLNAYKYNYRQDHKGQTEQDVAKAKWYDTIYNKLRQGASIYDALVFVRGELKGSKELITAKKLKVPTPEVCKLLNWDNPTLYIWYKALGEWYLTTTNDFENTNLHESDCVYAPQTDDIIANLPAKLNGIFGSVGYHLEVLRSTVGYFSNDNDCNHIFLEKVKDNHYAQALALLYSKVKEVHHGL